MMPSGISLVSFAKVIKNSDSRKSQLKKLQRYMKRTPEVIHKTFGVHINPACRILHRGQPSFHVAKAHS